MKTLKNKVFEYNDVNKNTCIILTAFIYQIFLTVDYFLIVLFLHKNMFDQKYCVKFCIEMGQK